MYVLHLLLRQWYHRLKVIIIGTSDLRLAAALRRENYKLITYYYPFVRSQVTRLIC